MATTAWEAANRAELFVRADLPTPAKKCRKTATSRLESFVASGVLEEFSVTTWAKRVPMEAGVDLGTFERARYNEFSAWARAAGVRLAPFFDTRECYSSTTGERQTQLVLPAACLALYDEDDELVAVTPHADERGSVSIADCFERLAAVHDEDSDTDRTRTITAD